VLYAPKKAPPKEKEVLLYPHQNQIPINMHTSISHLTGKEQNDLHHITKRIVENIGPELIYLYGSRLVHEINRSFFIEKRRTETFTSMYDLVIIISDEERLEEGAIRIFCENIARQYGKVNLIVHRKDYLIQQIVEGNFFFCWIHRFAIMLHSREKLPEFVLKGKSKAVATLYKEVYPGFTKFQANAKSYLRTARERQKEKAYPIALHMVKQSVENSCQSLIYSCTGYLAATGNLPRIFNYTRNFTADAISIFPENTKEEKRLFQLLVDAAGTSHTNELRNATTIELIILIDRAEQMYQLSERLFHKRMAGFKTNENPPVEESTKKNTEDANNHHAGASDILS
jgi:HEPN domain-containing protein